MRQLLPYAANETPQRIVFVVVVFVFFFFLSLKVQAAVGFTAEIRMWLKYKMSKTDVKVNVITKIHHLYGILLKLCLFAAFMQIRLWVMP